jgi:hypothetical protein
VAVLSRNADSMHKLANSLGPEERIRGYPCDVGSDVAVHNALLAIQNGF